MRIFFKRIIIVVFIFLNFLSYSQAENKSKFKNEYNTWAIGAGFSMFVLHGDLRSFDTYSGDAYFNPGGYIYIDKMFNPILGIEVKFNISQIGGEVQKIYSTGNSSELSYYSILYALAYSDKVLYVDGVSYGLESSLIIDLGNLWKRNSLKWNWCGYLGVGYHKYTSKLIIKDYVFDKDYPEFPLNDVREDGTILDADYGFNPNRDFANGAGSLYINAGIGVKYKLNNKFDFEARGVVNINNEDHLDAAISRKQVFESFITANIGIVYKLGKKKKYAIWAQDKEVEPFKFVDTDGDGVPDIYDKEPNTPKGADVYGSGIAIDTDKDGVQDYEDDCPLIPGDITNNGCPIQPKIVFVEPVLELNEQEKNDLLEKINLLSKSIYFKTTSDQITPEYYKLLNEIAGVMLEYPDSRFKIKGHTDNRGDVNYNLNLSKKRSKSVYNYLINKDVASERLSFKGYGGILPIISNDTNFGRQINRRVEINFIHPDSEEGQLVYPKGTVLRRSNSSVD